MGLGDDAGRARPNGDESTEAAAPRRSQRRFITVLAGSLLLLALALILIAAGPARADDDPYANPVGQDDNVVIFDRDGLYFEVHVTLDSGAKPYEIGQEYARAMLQADPWWMVQVWTYMTASHFLVVPYPVMVARAAAIRQQVSPEVRGYIEGMASVVTARSGGWVNENDCYILNLYPDVARPTMCSALGTWGSLTAGGKPILGRNLDWSNDPILPKLNAVTIYHNGARSFCSLGYLGLWQVISGFNPSGLYGGILDADTGQPYPDPTNRSSYAMDLRTALETTKTIGDAAKVMQKNAYCFNHQIVLADKTRVGILENDLTSGGPWSRKVRFDNTPLIDGVTWGYKDAVCAVNSFIAKGNNSAKFTDAWNTERWKSYVALMKTIGKTMTVAKMEDCLSYGDPDSKTRPYNDQTVQMMVYQPVSRHLDLFMKPRSGDLPKKPAWTSIDVDFGTSMFADRWVRAYQPEGWEVVDARVTPDDRGGVYAALQLSHGGADQAICVVRYAPNGSRRWTRMIDPAGDAGAELAGLAAAPGAVVVGGTQTSGDGTAWVTARYTVKGKRSWLKAGATAGHADQLGGVVCDRHGNVYAGGGVAVVSGAATSQDWSLRKYSAGGRRVWEKILASAAGLDETITGVTRLGATTVVAGTWAGSDTTGQLAVARFSDAGVQSWFTPWTQDGIGAPAPSGVCAAASGVAVCGQDAAPGGGNGRVALKLDPATGAVAWSFADSPFAAGQSSAFHGVAIDAQGHVVAGGQTRGILAAGSSCLLSWFGDDGDETTTAFGGDGGGVNLVSAVTTSGGGVQYGGAVTYATGADTAGDGAGQSMTTTAWSPRPQLRWSMAYSDPGGAACTGYDLALSGVRLFVAGSAGNAFVLAKYDTTTATPAEPER